MADAAAAPSPREVWEGVAPAWEANADFVARTGQPVQRWLVDRLDPRPGDTVLELAAGPGDTGFEIAGRLGPEGRLISTDIAPGMVDVARRRSEGRDLDNVEFRVMDAQDIELDDASVDGVVHRFGPMLLPDPEASFREVRRVLREGGRYAAAVIGPPEENLWVGLLMMSLMQHGHQMPGGGSPMDPGGPFSLADAESFAERVASSGLREVEVEKVEQPFVFESLEEAWRIQTSLAGPAAKMVAGLGDEDRERVKESFVDLVSPHREGEGYRLPGRAVCVSARR